VSGSTVVLVVGPKNICCASPSRCVVCSDHEAQVNNASNRTRGHMTREGGLARDIRKRKTYKRAVYEVTALRD
jgi:hypothetical protein